MPAKLNALIVCPSAQKRNLLYKGISEFPSFETVRQASDFEQGLSKLEGVGTWHALFFSPDLQPTDTTKFINSVRDVPPSRDAVTVLLEESSSDEDEEEERADWRKLGIDTFLRAPYTIDSFRQVTEDIATVIASRRFKRQSSRVKEFVNLLLAQINLVALNKRHGEPSLEENLIKLAKIKQEILSFNQEEQALYLSMVVDVTTDEVRPQRSGVYHGASTRLRKKYQKKLERTLGQ